MSALYLKERLDTILRCLPEDDAQVVRHALLEQHAAGRLRERNVDARWQMLALSVGLAVFGLGVVWAVAVTDNADDLRAVEQKCLATLGIIEGRVP